MVGAVLMEGCRERRGGSSMGEAGGKPGKHFPHNTEQAERELWWRAQARRDTWASGQLCSGGQDLVCVPCQYRNLHQGQAFLHYHLLINSCTPELVAQVWRWHQVLE